MNLANYITIGSAILLSILVLVQTRGASLGAGLGTGGEVNIVRRGADKTVFQMTIVVAITFGSSLLYNIF